VAKFGLPVRGFRDARHAGPGHELTTSRNVLTRGVIDGNGDVVAVGEAGGAGSHDDA
jgi:NAD+ kinase